MTFLMMYVLLHVGSLIPRLSLRRKAGRNLGTRLACGRGGSIWVWTAHMVALNIKELVASIYVGMVQKYRIYNTQTKANKCCAKGND